MFRVPDESVCEKTWNLDLSPNGLIRRFALHFGTQFAYRAGDETWYRWDGRVWRQDFKDRQAMDAVRCVAESIVHVEAKLAAQRHHEVQSLEEQQLAAQAVGDAQEATKLAAELRSVKKRIEAEQAAYGRRCQLETAVRAAAAGAKQHLLVPEDEWDGPRHLLNVQNGAVDLRTGRLFPTLREYYFTQITRCRYVQNARHDYLDAVIEHLTDGHPERAEFFQRWMGQAVTGEVSAASLLYLWGAAQVGKSTLLESLMAALGEGGDPALSYASGAKPEAFQKKKASHDEGFHHLRRCRLVCINEVQGGMLDASKLKAISGGDSYDSRQAGGSTVKYRPRMSIAMTSNKLTIVAPEDKGFMERFQPYKVTRQLGKSERRPLLKETLRDTAPGQEAVLAWAVAGAVKWYAAGANNAALAAPAYFEDSLRHFTRDMDTLSAWLDDNTVPVDPAHRESFPHKAIDLWTNYRAYTEGKGLGKANFYHELAQAGFERTQKVRWTIVQGPRAGASQAPAYWVPGLHLVNGPGSFGHALSPAEYLAKTRHAQAFDHRPTEASTSPVPPAALPVELPRAA